jgi:hypothetical protein
VTVLGLELGGRPIGRIVSDVKHRIRAHDLSTGGGGVGEVMNRPMVPMRWEVGLVQPIEGAGSSAL